MEAVQKLEKQYTETQPKLEAKRLALRQLRGEYARVTLGWDRYSPPLDATAGQNGALNLTIGAGAGIQQNQVLYVFAATPEGASQYVGAFKATTVRDNSSTLVPNWRLRPGDLPAAAKFICRLRTMIPPQYQEVDDDYEVRLAVADELVAQHQRELDQQTAQIQVATEHLDLRLKEINGDPSLDGKELPPEQIQGLLAVIQTEEDGRNAALEQNDHLRRELKKTGEAFESIRRQNERLVDSLPQPSPPPPVNIGRR
jgi:hypothetical protein